jgi:TRAP-type C4-dicarboxylate transport system substrate-binding protein
MRTARARIQIGVMALGLALLAACSSPHHGGGSSAADLNEQHVTWRMQVAPTDSAAVGGTLDALARNLNTMTNGVVTLKIYYGSSLQLDPNQMIELVQNKTVDASFTPNAGATIPEADIPTLPGLVPAYSDPTATEAFRRKVMDGLASTLSPLFAAKNQVYMGGILGTPSSLITTGPIGSLSQLSGKNIVTISPTAGSLMKSFGATNVTNMTQVDWYTSLQTGVINGIFINPSSMYGNKVQEVAKNYLNINIGGGSIYLTINKADFDALSANTQTEVKAAYAKFLDSYWNFQYQDSFTSDVDAMQKAGVKVSSMSSADAATVTKNAAKIVANYANSATPTERTVLNKVRALVKQDNTGSK